MRTEISISLSNLLQECIAQTSVDFSALRVANPQTADTVYDDYTLSTDNRPEFMTQVRLHVAFLDAMLGKSVSVGRFDGDTVWLRLDDAVAEVGCGTLERLIGYFMKSGVLAWWYTGRSEVLQQRYAAENAAVRTELSWLLKPHFMDRRLRLF